MAESGERERGGGGAPPHRDLAEAVVETSGALVVVLDRQGRIVRFNRAAEQATGWSFAEVRGQHVWDLFLVPSEADEVRKVFGSLVAGDFPSRHENHWRTRDGALRLVDWSNTALLDGRGEVEHVVATGIDVTAQRLAEAELRRHAARAQALADASRAFQAGLDYRRTLETVAERMAELVGDGCLVRVVSEDGVWLEPVAYAHRDPARRALVTSVHQATPQRADEGLTGEVLRTGVSLLVPEVTPELVRTRMKPAYWAYLKDVASLLIVPLRARERVLGHVTLTRDAPGPPYAEEDRAFLEDLAVRASQAVENARLYGVAREAVAARDEFLSVASHELRTPLTALKLALQALRRTGGRDPEAVRRAAEMAERQSTRLEKLVAALLDVSRIQSGRLELALEDLDLASVVSEVATQFEGQLAEAGCSLLTHFDGPGRGRWDRLRIGQVLTNLLSNAVKYGAGKPVAISVSGDGESVRVAVRDHGIGLPPDDPDRIFQRFVRAVSSRHYGGLGLGLYIARRLAEAHGGTLRAEPAEGGGACFVLELPVRGPA